MALGLPRIALKTGRALAAAMVLLPVMMAPAASWAQSLIRDTEIEEILRKQSNPIFAAAGLEPNDVKILLVNDKELNAFATQGQIIGLHTGMILEADTPNELNGVIAHEAGHLSGGHTARSGEMMRAGRVWALAASGDRRVPSMPDVPNLRELGFSDRFSFSGFSGLLAPARTPQPVLDRLVEALRVAAAKPETHGRLLAIDTFPSYQDPPTFRAQIERNLREWTEIATALNLSVDS